MATVTARYTDAQGNPATGTVYLSPAARAGIGEPADIVTEKRVWADLDAQGSISIEVIPSDDPGWLIDGEMPYLVEERLMGLSFRAYHVIVPTAGVDLADVAITDPEVTVAVRGPAGPPGPPGPSGPPGGAVLSGWWSYSNKTTGPAAVGEVRTNGSGVIGEQVTIWLNAEDDDGLDWSLVSVTPGDQAVLRSVTGETWTLTIDAIPQAGEWTATLLSSTGSAPKKNSRVQVSLVPA